MSIRIKWFLKLWEGGIMDSFEDLVKNMVSFFEDIENYKTAYKRDSRISLQTTCGPYVKISSFRLSCSETQKIIPLIIYQIWT